MLLNMANGAESEVRELFPSSAPEGAVARVVPTAPSFPCTRTPSPPGVAVDGTLATRAEQLTVARLRDPAIATRIAADRGPA